MKKMNKKITRWSMLKSTTALAGAALGSGLITGFPAIHASGTPTIRYLGTAVNMGSEPEKKLFEEVLDIETYDLLNAISGKTSYNQKYENIIKLIHSL